MPHTRVVRPQAGSVRGPRLSLSMSPMPVQYHEQDDALVTFWLALPNPFQ